MVKRGVAYMSEASSLMGLKNPVFIENLTDFSKEHDVQQKIPDKGIDFRNILQLKAGIIPDFDKKERKK